METQQKEAVEQITRNILIRDTIVLKVTGDSLLEVLLKLTAFKVKKVTLTTIVQSVVCRTKAERLNIEGDIIYVKSNGYRINTEHMKYSKQEHYDIYMDEEKIEVNMKTTTHNGSFSGATLEIRY